MSPQMPSLTQADKHRLCCLKYFPDGQEVSPSGVREGNKAFVLLHTAPLFMKSHRFETKALLSHLVHAARADFSHSSPSLWPVVFGSRLTTRLTCSKSHVPRSRTSSVFVVIFQLYLATGFQEMLSGSLLNGMKQVFFFFQKKSLWYVEVAYFVD